MESQAVDVESQAVAVAKAYWHKLSQLTPIGLRRAWIRKAMYPAIFWELDRIKLENSSI